MFIIFVKVLFYLELPVNDLIFFTFISEWNLRVVDLNTRVISFHLLLCLVLVQVLFYRRSASRQWPL